MSRLFNDRQWSEACRNQARYSYAVHCETVYNHLFALLPLYPVALRRRVARWLATRLNPSEPAYYDAWSALSQAEWEHAA